LKGDSSWLNLINGKDRETPDGWIGIEHEDAH
jgi:hypothetical protein